MAITEKYQEIEKRLMMMTNGQTIKENQIIQVIIFFLSKNLNLILKELESQIHELDEELNNSDQEKQNLEEKIKILIREVLIICFRFNYF